jgi:5'-phosphate synthase pdxT subunit
MVKKITIGVLALQGDFLEHLTVLKKLGISTKEVRLPEDLDNIDGIILPGGESTTMVNLLDVFKLKAPLIQKIKKGMPVWGTCAGMILLAKKLKQDNPIPLGLMDITVNRNAYGRQIDSFTTNLKIKPLGEKDFAATFIRAPILVEVGKGVEVLSKLDPSAGSGQAVNIVAVRQKNMLATSFHPELTRDTRFHEYFISTLGEYLL